MLQSVQSGNLRSAKVHKVSKTVTLILRSMRANTCADLSFIATRVFFVELQNIRRDATPHTCTEHEFMLALKHTNQSLTMLDKTRNFTESLQYKGPQSYAHLTDLSRLKFELDPAIHSTQRVADPEDPFTKLQCVVCEKWRRVDYPTHKLFSNKEWQKEKVTKDVSCVFSCVS